MRPRRAPQDIIIRTAIPFYGWLPTPTQFYIRDALVKAKELQERLFDQSVKRIESDPDAPRTMLSEMLRLRKSNDKDAAGLTNQEIADELQTIRGAGHETTSNTLCWAMLLLARNPHELARLREESDRVVKGETATYLEAKEMLGHLHAVLETLRLYPTVPSFPREAHRDVVLKSSGFDIPAGSFIFVSQRALNRFGWDRPDDFVPDRFKDVKNVNMGMPVGNPATGKKYGYVPLGASLRACTGQRLAILEAVQALATVTKNVEWTLASDAPIAEVADVTLGPKHGLWFNVRRRIAPSTTPELAPAA